MISVPDLETTPKWNTSTDTQTEIIIENANEEKYNLSQNFYNVITKTDEKDDCANVTHNITELVCDEKAYDCFEVGVVIILCLLIVVTVIGNTLIISAVVTTKRLRTVTNCFVTSLAVADLLVGIFVMPPAIAVHITGEFAFFITSILICIDWWCFDKAVSKATIKDYIKIQHTSTVKSFRKVPYCTLLFLIVCGLRG